jgi:hypothetical protein
MVASQVKRAVGVFPNRQTAETALNELQGANFPMERVSVIAKQAEGEELSGVDVSDRVEGQNVDPTNTATEIASTSATVAVMAGLSSLAIPGIGAVLAAGSAVAALAATVAGEGMSAAATGRVVKALQSMGIPQNKAEAYSDRLIQGRYVVLVEGSDPEIDRAAQVFSDRGIQEWGVYASA